MWLLNKKIYLKGALFLLVFFIPLKVDFEFLSETKHCVEIISCLPLLEKKNSTQRAHSKFDSSKYSLKIVLNDMKTNYNSVCKTIDFKHSLTFQNERECITCAVYTLWKVQKILPYALKSENTYPLIVYGECFHSLILRRVPLKPMLCPWHPFVNL